MFVFSDLEINKNKESMDAQVFEDDVHSCSSEAPVNADIPNSWSALYDYCQRWRG